KRGLGIIGSIINFIRSEGNLLIGIIAIGVLVIGLAWWLIKRRKKKRLKKREITEPRARVLKRGYGQTGETDIGHDQKVRALLPGKRISKKGKVYYERRMDHSDVHGKKSTNKWRGSK
ncbi:MAG: LPXTG cell wall anchor domain-containing protein, partial [Nanoarchaeota archaeon]|nr:LPXTG cell wall anchor domain-containing protein [Nanoarchaeota archaeon]